MTGTLSLLWLPVNSPAEDVDGNLFPIVRIPAMRPHRVYIGWDSEGDRPIDFLTLSSRCMLSVVCVAFPGTQHLVITTSTLHGCCDRSLAGSLFTRSGVA